MLITLSVVLTAAGLGRPEFAGRAAQLLVACATLAIVTTLFAGRWGTTARQVRPFAPPEPVSTTGVETPDVTELVHAVEGSDGRVPPLIAKRIAEACRGRLADRHRLYLHSPNDQGTIRAAVSPAMWALLSRGPDDAVEISIRSLPQLLDEVEDL